MAHIKRAGAPMLVLCVVAGPAWGQALDLSHGGPVTVTAAGGIDWDQNAKTVTAHDDARAVRGDVTVTADRLIAHYRKKAGATDDSTPGVTPGAAPAASPAATSAPPAGASSSGSVTGAPDESGSN